ALFFHLYVRNKFESKGNAYPLLFKTSYRRFSATRCISHATADGLARLLHEHVRCEPEIDEIETNKWDEI
ncbi:hypothetical protein, partial [Pontibacter sp. HSC-36F09]|uniref:hypothetical protein n=1 Tax=Pontibacter sp. HSC-36F09 TaxID=2910966 RepID=UPI00209EC969